MFSAFLWGGIAASSLLIGYALAGRGLSNRTISIIMGIGAGALISAIAYELVPESVMENPGIALAFGAGAIAFFIGDWLVNRLDNVGRMEPVGEPKKGSGLTIFIGTLLDALPESAVLGMGLALGGNVNVAFMGAVFISNLPEGTAGSVNLLASGYPQRRIFWMWMMMVLLSAVFAAVGYAIVRLLPAVNGLHAQAFAAGAMLTMLADAMIPEAFEHGGKPVGLFTVLGFLLGAILSIAQ